MKCVLPDCMTAQVKKVSGTTDVKSLRTSYQTTLKFLM